MDEFEFDELERKSRPPAPPMAPPITITIGSPPPPLEALADCDEYTEDMDDYSKPNPMRAMKAMFGKG